jgi:5'-nucleotidase
MSNPDDRDAAFGVSGDRDSLAHVTTASGSGGAPPAAGPYLQTISGRRVNPFDPDPGQLDEGDIARALGNLCRFGGHSRVFYSVAQHCVIVSRVVEERGGDVEDAFAALMHDAGEAYLGDMPHPLKHRSALGAAFRDAESRLEETIRDRFGIKANVPEIKAVDRALLATERRAFSAEVWHWPELEDVEPLELELTPWSPDQAADEFAKRYAELEARR